MTSYPFFPLIFRGRSASGPRHFSLSNGSQKDQTYDKPQGPWRDRLCDRQRKRSRSGDGSLNRDINFKLHASRRRGRVTARCVSCESPAWPWPGCTVQCDAGRAGGRGGSQAHLPGGTLTHEKGRCGLQGKARRKDGNETL